MRGLLLQKVGGEQDAASLPERTNAVAGEYARAVKRIGEDLGIPVVDLWTNLQMQPLWQAYLSDGLHFTSAGNAIVYQLVQAKINEALPHLRCSTVIPSCTASAASLLHCNIILATHDPMQELAHLLRVLSLVQARCAAHGLPSSR